MAGVLRTAAAALSPITALVTGNILGLALSSPLAAAVLSLRPPRPPITGQPLDWKADPQAAIPYVVGRTATAGNIVFAQTHGPANKPAERNKHLSYFTILGGGGPYKSIGPFTAGDEVVNFVNQEATGRYGGRMWMVSQLGLCPSPRLAPPSKPATDSPLPEWTAAHKLSGYAATIYGLEQKEKETKYPNGTPKPLWVVEGALAYDPRQDSTYPGGLGPCRALDESTYVWSENPFLHALTWALGRWQNGKRVLGVGAPIAAIRVADFVEGANVCDANGWKLGGVVNTAMSKSAVLSLMLQAGGGWWTRVGGRLGCGVDAPKVSLDTVRTDDIIGEARVTVVQSRRDRINTVVPRYRSEEHKWQMVAAGAVAVAAHITEDGGPRTREIEYGLVQSAKQAAELARYDIENGREMQPITLRLKPRWNGFMPGHCLTVDEPETGLNGQKVVIIERSAPDPVTGERTFTCRSETDGKHPFALGQAAAPPPAPALTGIDLLNIPAPAEGAWTATGGVLAGADGAEVPAVIVAGATDSPEAQSVIVEYRPATSQEWRLWTEGVPGTTRIEITGLAPQISYVVGVSYRTRGGVGLRREVAAVTTGGSIATDFAGAGFLARRNDVRLGLHVKNNAGTALLGDGDLITTQGTAADFLGRGPWARDSTPVNSVTRPAPNIIPDGGLRLRAKGWTLTGAVWVGAWNGARIEALGAAHSTQTARGVFDNAGATIAVSFDFQNNRASGSWTWCVIYYNEAGAEISRTESIPIPAGQSGRIAQSVGVAPAGVRTLSVRYEAVGGSGGYSEIKKVKAAGEVAPSVFTDEATTGALYSNAADIDTLMPQEVGANKTETRVAADFLGRGPWARDSTPVNSVTRPAPNIIPDGGLRLRAKGWTVVGMVWASSFNGYRLEASGANHSLRSARGVFDNPNVNLSVSFGYQSNRTDGSWAWDLIYYNESGVEIGRSDVRPLPPGSGRIAVVVGAPPVGVRGVEFHVEAVGGLGGYAEITKVKVAGEVAPSVFTDEATTGALYADRTDLDTLRPGEVGANKTETRVSADFSGRGALARDDFVRLGGNLRRNDATTLVNDVDVITSLGVASGIAGQAPAATDLTIAAGATRNRLSRRTDAVGLESTTLTGAWLTIATAVHDVIAGQGEWDVGWSCEVRRLPSEEVTLEFRVLSRLPDGTDEREVVAPQIRRVKRPPTTDLTEALTVVVFLVALSDAQASNAGAPGGQRELVYQVRDASSPNKAMRVGAHTATARYFY